MSDERSSLIEKIKALLAKTIDAGCTEAEAEIALAKASAMMEVYQISPADLELTKQEKAVLAAIPIGKNHIASMLSLAVAGFTHTEAWQGDKEIKFCGLPVDVDFATFLLRSLRSFTEREMVDYLARTPHERRQTRALINGFSIGCCRRISARLADLTERAKSPAGVPSTGNALAVVQNAAIDAYKAEHGIHLRSRRASSVVSNHDAHGAGRAAGDRASFGRPIGHGGALRLGTR